MYYYFDLCHFVWHQCFDLCSGIKNFAKFSVFTWLLSKQMENKIWKYKIYIAGKTEHSGLYFQPHHFLEHRKFHFFFWRRLSYFPIIAWSSPLKTVQICLLWIQALTVKLWHSAGCMMWMKLISFLLAYWSCFSS